MNNQTSSPPPAPGPAPAPALFSIIQHNCLGSLNVFVSLFESFKEPNTYPSMVLLQDPPVNKAHLPSFNDFKSFFPPVRKPSVAAYVHMSFLSKYTVLPRFKGVDDVLALDISSDVPLFGTTFHSFRVINAYSTNTADYRVHSVPPEVLFPDLGFPLLVLGTSTSTTPSRTVFGTSHMGRSCPQRPILRRRRNLVSPSLTPQVNTRGFPWWAKLALRS